MWMRVFQALLSRAILRAEGANLIVLERSFRLLQSLSNIQSEPSEAIVMAECAVSEFEESQSLFDSIAEHIRGGEPVSAIEWLSLAYLADLAMELKTGWDDSYERIFQAYPGIGVRVTRIVTFLEMFPFDVGLKRLADAWLLAEPHPFEDALIAVYLTACAHMGTRGEPRLYAKVVEQLAFNGIFIYTLVAACCVKRLDAIGLLDLSNMSEEQYECMALVDNFHTLPGGAWG